MLVSIVVATYLLGPIVDLKITKAQQDLETLQIALAIYRSKHGHLPSEADGLEALTGLDEPVANLPKDPWLNSYVYRHLPGTDAYRIYSPGLNHLDEGGSGDDIILGEKSYLCADYGVNCPPSIRRIGGATALMIAALSLCVGLWRIGMATRRSMRKERASR
jgi:hypothetical protein